MSFEYENEEVVPERQITPEEFLLLQKSSIRKKSWWAIGIGGFLVAVHLLWLLLFLVAGLKPDFSILFQSILFILGFFALVGGVWGIYYAKNLTLGDLLPSPQAVEFLQSVQGSKLIYTYILVGSIIVVTLIQFKVGLENSFEIAGFDKPLFKSGEWWRILTGGALHGGVLHIYFNGQAFYGFGSLIEVLSNRAHLAIVFLLSVIGGGILSLIFMPDGRSVGASGGIMGLIGFLAIYGYRRKKQLPPDFLKTMLINIGFIAAFGLVAYQIIDNFGHLGGFLTGAVYGFFQIPGDLRKDPRQTNVFTKILGVLSLAIFVLVSIFSILLLLRIIVL